MSGAAVLRFAKLSQNAISPTRGSKHAAGYDLYRYFLHSKFLLVLHFIIFFYSAYDYDVPAMGKIIAKTDIQIQLPGGCYGRVAPRSGC